MNLLSIRTVKSFTRLGLFLLFSVVQVSVRAWEVDMSRRQKELLHSRIPASVIESPASKGEGVLGNVFESLEASQEIVILNTEKGFVPSTVRLKQGQRYQIHVVNINSNEKNTSFVLDSFSEHHATYYGQEKSFSLTPKMEGIFSFQCPETAMQGKFVIAPENDRKPAAVK